MLSIGKLAAGQQEYYLRSVAAGVEDYYLGSGEAEGRWIGDGAGKLELFGTVTREQLAAVLDGRHPQTGEALSSSARRKLPGWDLTFSAPKSVSLLYALAPAVVQQILVTAHEHAVETGFGYLQREAGFVRRGHNGTRLEPGAGLIGAAFRHRTSRAGDPQLHTHVLLPNLVATQDGQWRTVHSRAFYRHARTAGALYRAALRDSLTQQLGVTWRSRQHGLFEIAGIPQPVLRAFSRRRADIENLLEERGLTSAKAADVATLATRTAKRGAVDELGLHERWRQRADELGFDRDALLTVLGRQGRDLFDRIGAGQPPSERAPDLAQPVAPPSAPVGQESGQRLDELSRRRLREQLLGPAGLTAQVTVFRRRDVIRAICDQLPAGAPVEAIESLAEEILADREVIRLIDLGEDLARFDERTVFSTRELLNLEQRILTTATRGQSTGRGQVPEVLLRIALADHGGLSDEQQRMVDRVCRYGHSVDLIVGTPGSGKTRALAAAYAGWRKARFPVSGCSVKASAAAELETGSGIPSTTIARLLLDLERIDPATGQPASLPAGTVLVVDEAGMLGTRHLAQLLAHTQKAHGKLVLVGDPKQLPSINAAGLFPLLANRLGAATLTGNRRQSDPADRDALSAYRNEDVAAALASYANRGRLHQHPTATTQREAMVAAWWTDQSQGIESVMLAYRRADIRALNHAARTRLLAAGQLAGPAVTVTDEQLGERTFQTGDRVLLRRNDYRHGIHNGDTGTIQTVDPKNGNLTVALTRGNLVTLPTGYVSSGLDHSYALTIHASQGLTITRTHVLANDALFYEAGLVAISRHQDSCHLYLTDALDPSFEHDRERGHVRQEHPDVALTLQRSRADDAALAHHSRGGR